MIQHLPISASFSMLLVSQYCSIHQSPLSISVHVCWNQFYDIYCVVQLFVKLVHVIRSTFYNCCLSNVSGQSYNVCLGNVMKHLSLFSCNYFFHQVIRLDGTLCIVLNGGWVYPGVEFIWKRINYELLRQSNSDLESK